MARQVWRKKVNRGQQEAEWIGLLQWLLPQLGYRWAGFRKVRNQVIKRIKRRMHTLGLHSPAEYQAYLEQQEAEWLPLDQLCCITISRFWRDRLVFQALLEQVLPALSLQVRQTGRTQNRAMSVGCCSGEEPYSLLLAWELGLSTEQRNGLGLQILAMDRNALVLKRARQGIYAPASLRELPRAWLGQAFSEVASGYQLDRSLCSQVDFVCQDLRVQLPAGPFQLILCRNLLYTYFRTEQQRQLQQRLVERLTPGGFLVVGSHEQPVSQGAQPLERFAPAIYRLTQKRAPTFPLC